MRVRWTYQILRDHLSKLETVDLALGLLSQLAELCGTKDCETNVDVVQFAHRV